MNRILLQSGTYLGIAALITCLVAGCSWSVGGGHGAHQPTRGQEMIDLKQARDQGAISEAEYQAQRNKVLGR